LSPDLSQCAFRRSKSVPKTADRRCPPRIPLDETPSPSSVLDRRPSPPLLCQNSLKV
jgi:hypothetical protein